MSTPEAAPLIEVVSGSPSDEDLAVVIAFVTARGAAAPVATPQFSVWARRSRQIRPALRPGFGAWRASMLPR